MTLLKNGQFHLITLCVLDFVVATAIIYFKNFMAFSFCLLKIYLNVSCFIFFLFSNLSIVVHIDGRYRSKEMSKATKRKHVTKEVLDDFVLPTEKQKIVKVL